MTVGREQIRDIAVGLEMGGLDGWEYPYQEILIDDRKGQVVGFWKQVARRHARRRHAATRWPASAARGSATAATSSGGSSATGSTTATPRACFLEMMSDGTLSDGHDGADAPLARRRPPRPLPARRRPGAALARPVDDRRRSASSGWARSARPWRRAWSAGPAGSWCSTSCPRRPRRSPSRARSWPTTSPTLGAACDVISVMVRDDAQVRDGRRPSCCTTAKPGTVIAVHSTIRAETAEELARHRGRARRRPARRAGERRVHGRPRRHAGRDGRRRARGLRAGQGRVRALGRRWSCTWARSAPAPGRSWPATSCTSSPTRPRARRSGWPRRPASTCSKLARGGAPLRRGHRRARGDHGPRHHRADGARRRPVRDLHATPASSARRTSTLALELADELGLDLPLAKQALRGLRPEPGPAEGLDAGLLARRRRRGGGATRSSVVGWVRNRLAKLILRPVSGFTM